LNLKINAVHLKLVKYSFRGLWDALAASFPDIAFKVCKDEDSNWQRNVANTAHLLGLLYSFNEIITRWEFRERKAIGNSNAITKDNGYRSLAYTNQEAWAYRNFDAVFGFPTIVRFTHLRSRKILMD
jgi:hypothetical protein